MFDSFKKRPLLTSNDSQIEQLELEFKQEQARHAMFATSEICTFINTYYDAKIEINRDRIEILNPLDAKDQVEIVKLQAKNEVMRDFISDIEGMKLMAEQNRQDG